MKRNGQKFGAAKLFNYLDSCTSVGFILVVFFGGFCTFGYLLIADMFQSEGFQTNLHWDYCSYFWICSHIFVFFYLHAADMVEVIFLTTTSELL